MFETTAWTAADVFEAAGTSDGPAVPVWCLTTDAAKAFTAPGPVAAAWLSAQKFSGAAKRQLLLPAADGALAGVALGLGDGQQGEPCGPSVLLTGQLAAALPAGTYRLEVSTDAELAAVAWGLGAYRFARYRTSKATDAARPRLRLPDGIDARRVMTTVEAVWFGRDLINTPASDLGPAEIEAAVRELAARHGATVTSIVGDDLLSQNLPMIHAVGRASPRPPRLVDLRWGRAGARKITLVGKGISFDTGGLDIKPPSAMLLMKKDMGGAATVLTLAHMIMSEKLDVALRVLIPTAENSVSGDAFRPGDVLVSRAGLTVEVGNTDAEGRLVLADALALADEDEPDTLLVFATLTGAARSALGPDLPAFFTDDEDWANALPPLAASIGDPVWRMPLWEGYKRHLDSDVADMNNVWESPFAGAITATLFLRRFVAKARRFAHFDLYGWRTAARPLGPKGGEPQTARAVMAKLRRELTA